MELTLEELLMVVEKKSENISDKHFTIFRFTTHWKGMFGTPNLDGGGDRNFINDLKAFDTIEEVFWDLIKKEL